MRGSPNIVDNIINDIMFKANVYDVSLYDLYRELIRNWKMKHITIITTGITLSVFKLGFLWTLVIMVSILLPFSLNEKGIQMMQLHPILSQDIENLSSILSSRSLSKIVLDFLQSCCKLLLKEISLIYYCAYRLAQCLLPALVNIDLALFIAAVLIICYFGVLWTGVLVCTGILLTMAFSIDYKYFLKQEEHVSPQYGRYFAANQSLKTTVNAYGLTPTPSSSKLIVNDNRGMNSHLPSKGDSVVSQGSSLLALVKNNVYHRYANDTSDGETSSSSRRYFSVINDSFSPYQIYQRFDVN